PIPTTLPLGNADFETGPFNTVGTVSSWTVTGNIGDTTEGSTSGSHCAALSAGGDSQGDALAQSFFTTPNQVYTVDFDAAVFGSPSNEANLQLQISLIRGAAENGRIE